MNKTFERLWVETQGQDLIEYAIMAGFVAVAAVAIMPQVAAAVSMGVLGDTQHASLVRLISAMMAAVFVGIIVFRRKKDADM